MESMNTTSCMHNLPTEREGESSTNTTTIDAAAGALYDVRDTLVGVGC